MSGHIDPSSLELGEHRISRFNRRMPIGPACWDFHDLFWVHEGQVLLDVGEASGLKLDAPAGLLILPGTRFSGTAVGGFATASACHFRWPDAALPGPGYLLPRADEAMHVQAMLRLSLTLAGTVTPGDPDRRRRLLLAILDCFEHPDMGAHAGPPGGDERLEHAWQQATRALARVRSLSDVATFMGIHESALRARHRRFYQTSAGSHLRELRLRRAEDLLSTTRHSVAEIARMVGYGHPETFIAAFHRSRGCTPGQFRHRSNPLA